MEILFYLDRPINNSFFVKTGNKISISEPQNLVDAVKEALKKKKKIEGASRESPEDDDMKESKRSKG